MLEATALLNSKAKLNSLFLPSIYDCPNVACCGDLDRYNLKLFFD